MLKNAFIDKPAYLCLLIKKICRLKLLCIKLYTISEYPYVYNKHIKI
jgi:hypothetical protein